MSWHTLGRYFLPGKYRDLVMALVFTKSIKFTLSQYGKGATREIVEDATASLLFQVFAARAEKPELAKAASAVFKTINQVESDLMDGDATQSIQKLITLLESW